MVSGVFSSKIVGEVAKCTMNQRGAGVCDVGEVAADGERLVGSSAWHGCCQQQKRISPYRWKAGREGVFCFVFSM